MFQRPIEIRARFLIAAVTLMILTGSLFAQTTTGSIYGSVADESGGVIVAAEINITRVETGITQTMLSNEQGLFRVDMLPVGTYSIKATARGFSVATATAEVRTGIPTTVRMVLKIGSIAQTIEITATTSVELARHDLSRGEISQAVQDLPVLDRDVISLVTLYPSVPFPSERVTNDPTARRGNYNVGGTRWRNIVYNIDGTDNNDDRGSGVRQSVIQEAVQESRVLTNVYSAEHGRGAGGVVDITLKSGTNQLHGTAFENHRNHILNANDFFNNKATEYVGKPVERPQDIRNEYGFVLGGPIVKDRMFFFGAFQGNNIRLARPQTIRVVPNNQRVLGSKAGDGGPEVTRLIQEVYKLLPPTESGDIIGNAPYPLDYYNWSLKIDSQLSTADAFEFRYFSQRHNGESRSLLEPGTIYGNDGDYTFSGTWRHTFGSRRVNEFKSTILHYSRDYSTSAQLPDVNIAGFTSVGNNVAYPQLFQNKDLQFLDNLAWTVGRHFLKTGIDFRWKQLIGYSFYAGRGIYAFQPSPAALFGYDTVDRTGLTNFQNGRAIQFQQAIGDFKRDFRIWESSVYFQDDWKVRSNLALNLGIRYDVQLCPKIKGTTTGTRVYSGYDPFSAKYVDYQNDLNNVAPRLGLAWDPSGKGKSAIRGGYGLVFNRIAQDDYNVGGLLQPPLIQTYWVQLATNTGPIYFGRGLELAKGLPLAVSSIMRNDIRLPFTHTWSIGYQRDLGGNWSIEAGYVGTASRHLSQQNEFNRYDISKNPYQRFDTKQGSVLLIDDTAYSDYRALQIFLRKRFARSLFLTASYTWSKAEDVIFDGIAGTGSGRGSNGSNDARESSGAIPTHFDPGTREPLNQYEEGPAIFDRPHAVTLSYSYATPKIAAHRALRYLLNDWQISGIIYLQSGIPFSVLAGRDLSGDNVASGDRPDIVDSSILGKSFDNPNIILPRTAFATPLPVIPTATVEGKVGTYGNLPRNAFRRDGVAEGDLAIAKRFAFSDRMRMEFRTEFFNVLNHAQFNGPINNLASSTFGQIRSTANSPRNIRFGLKLRF